MINLLLFIIILLVGAVIFLADRWKVAARRTKVVTTYLDHVETKNYELRGRFEDLALTAQSLARTRHRDIYAEVAKELEAKKQVEWLSEVRSYGQEHR